MHARLLVTGGCWQTVYNMTRGITGGQGCHIEDRDGNRLLDAFAGLYCVNVGYGRQDIAEAIAAQAKV